MTAPNAAAPAVPATAPPATAPPATAPPATAPERAAHAPAAHTPPGPAEARAGVFDVGRAYEKHHQVAIRPEGFGGLAYHYGNRRLVFLKAPELVTLVESLADFASAREALGACVPAPRRAACEKALSSLLASGVIRAR